MIVCLSSILIACGGGGGGGGEKPRQTSEPPVVSNPPTNNDVATEVQLASELPDAARDAVVTLSSALEQKPFGQSLLVPNVTGSFILALTQSGDLLLASQATATGEITLSYESTALVLVRMMLDQTLITSMGADLDPLIIGTASFPSLINAIDSAVSNGLPVINSETATDAVVAVIRELLANSSTFSGLQSNSRIQSKLVVPPKVETPPLNIDDQDAKPETEEDAMVLVSDHIGGVFSGIRVEEMPGHLGRFLKVSNTTLLSWEVNTEDTFGNPSSIPTYSDEGPTVVNNDGSRAVIDGSSPAKLNALSGYKLGLPAKTVDLYYRHQNSNIFSGNLVLEQTDRTRLENAIRIIASSIDFLAIALPPSCVKGVVEEIVGYPEIASSLASGNIRLAVKRLELLSIADWAQVIGSVNNLSGCVVKGNIYDLAAYAFPMIRAKIKMIERIIEVGARLIGVHESAIAMQQYALYFQFAPQKWGYCVSTDWRMMNCVNSIRILPYQSPGEPPNLSPTVLRGAKLPIRLEILDVNNKPTFMPGGLYTKIDGRIQDEWDPTKLSLHVLKPYSGPSGLGYTDMFVEANLFLVGGELIEIVDYASDKSGAMYFDSVKEGTIKTEKTTLHVNEESEIRLVDLLDKTIFGNDLVVWETSDPTLVQVDKVSGLEFSPIIARVRALKPTLTGPVKVVAKHASDGSVLGEVELTILPNEEHWAGQFNITSCSAPTDELEGADYWYWFWERPCYTVGFYAGQYGSIFWLDDSGKVIFQSDNMRQSRNIGWKSTDSMMRLSIPTRVLVPDHQLQKFVSYTGSRDFELVVTNRTSTKIDGTFVVRSTAGLAPNGYVHASAGLQFVLGGTNGTWSLIKQNSPMPNVDMNGFDFCFSDNGGTNYIDLDSMVYQGSGNWYSNLHWGSTSGTCVYGR